MFLALTSRDIFYQALDFAGTYGGRSSSFPQTDLCQAQLVESTHFGWSMDFVLTNPFTVWFGFDASACPLRHPAGGYGLVWALLWHLPASVSEADCSRRAPYAGVLHRCGGFRDHVGGDLQALAVVTGCGSLGFSYQNSILNRTSTLSYPLSSYSYQDFTRENWVEKNRLVGALELKCERNLTIFCLLLSSLFLIVHEVLLFLVSQPKKTSSRHEHAMDMF